MTLGLYPRIMFFKLRRSQAHMKSEFNPRPSASKLGITSCEIRLQHPSTLRWMTSHVPQGSFLFEAFWQAGLLVHPLGIVLDTGVICSADFRMTSDLTIQSFCIQAGVRWIR